MSVRPASVKRSARSSRRCIRGSSARAGSPSDRASSASSYGVNQLALGTQIAAVQTTYGTSANIGTAQLSGVLQGDSVNLSGQASLVGTAFSSSGQLKAGSYQQSVGASLTGADANNYSPSATTTSNYVVTPKVITASVTAADKVYDGSAAATLQASSADIITGDSVTIAGLTGTFASKNVARDASGAVVAQNVGISGTNASLGGADSGNYSLSGVASIPTSTTATITPKALTVAGITASDKVYDGSAAATLNTSAAQAQGMVAGDSVSVSAQAAVSQGR